MPKNPPNSRPGGPGDPKPPDRANAAPSKIQPWKTARKWDSVSSEHMEHPISVPAEARREITLAALVSCQSTIAEHVLTAQSVGGVGDAGTATTVNTAELTTYVNLTASQNALQRFVDLVHTGSTGAAGRLPVETLALLPRELRGGDLGVESIAPHVPKGVVRTVPAGLGGARSPLRQMQWPVASMTHAARIVNCFKQLSTTKTLSFTGFAWTKTAAEVTRQLAEGEAPALLVRPRMARIADGANGSKADAKWARVARWEAAHWPVLIERMLIGVGLAPRAVTFTVDKSGKPSLRIEPAAARWPQTFDLLTRERLDVDGERASPHVSWRAKISPARGDEAGVLILEGVLAQLGRMSPEGYEGAWARETMALDPKAAVATWLIDGDMPAGWTPPATATAWRILHDPARPEAGGTDVSIVRVTRRIVTASAASQAAAAGCAPAPEAASAGGRSSAASAAADSTADANRRARRPQAATDGLAGLGTMQVDQPSGHESGSRSAALDQAGFPPLGSTGAAPRRERSNPEVHRTARVAGSDGGAAAAGAAPAAATGAAADAGRGQTGGRRSRTAAPRRSQPTKGHDDSGRPAAKFSRSDAPTMAVDSADGTGQSDGLLTDEQQAAVAATAAVTASTAAATTGPQPQTTRDRINRGGGGPGQAKPAAASGGKRGGATRVRSGGARPITDPMVTSGLGMALLAEAAGRALARVQGFPDPLGTVATALEQAAGGAVGVTATGPPLAAPVNPSAY